MDEQTVLAGYLRFIKSDKPGVIAEVISPQQEQHTHPSDVPIYRKIKNRTLTIVDL